MTICFGDEDTPYILHSVFLITYLFCLPFFSFFFMHSRTNSMTPDVSFPTTLRPTYTDNVMNCAYDTFFGFLACHVFSVPP
jgi:hypothetical protein